MAYDVTKTACEGLCIPVDNSQSPCLEGGESLALCRELSPSEGRGVRAAGRQLPAPPPPPHPNPFRRSVPLLFCLVSTKLCFFSIHKGKTQSLWEH